MNKRQRLGMIHATFFVPTCFGHSLEDSNMPASCIPLRAPDSICFSALGISKSRRMLSIGHTAHFPFQAALMEAALIGAAKTHHWDSSQLSKTRFAALISEEERNSESKWGATFNLRHLISWCWRATASPCDANCPSSDLPPSVG